jgi:hypothetical protein
MKVTKAQLKQIIKEEILALDEKWSWSKFKKDIGFGPKPEPEPEVEPEPESPSEEDIAAAEKAAKDKAWQDRYDAEEAAIAHRQWLKTRPYADVSAARSKEVGRKSDFERWQSDKDPDPAYNYMTRMEEKIYKRLEEMIRGKNEKA